MKDHQWPKRTLLKSSQPSSKKEPLCEARAHRTTPRAVCDPTGICISSPVFISPNFLWTASELHSWKRKPPATIECVLSTFSLQSASYSSHIRVLTVSWGNAWIKDKKEQGKEWSKRQTTKQNPPPPQTFWLNSSVNHVHDYSKVKAAFFIAST